MSSRVLSLPTTASLIGLFAVLAAHPVRAQEVAPALRAQAPLEIVHRQGRPLRLGLVAIEAGDIEDGPVGFRIRYDASGQDLGPPAWATWLMVLGPNYCRDQPTWVEAVLTAPSGRSWRGPRHGVAAGPAPSALKVFGFGDEARQPGLFEAFSQGGRFVLAFENSLGERWNETVIDTLDTDERERLFDANRATLRATAPASVPVTREDRVEYVGAPLGEAPPARSCPGA